MREIHNIDITNRIAKAVELARKVADASACGVRHGAVLINNGGAYINAASNKRNYSSFQFSRDGLKSKPPAGLTAGP